MVNRAISYRLIGFESLCFVIFFCDQLYGSPLSHRIEELEVEKSWKNVSEVEEAGDSLATLSEIQQVIDLQRRIIHDAMIDYQYPNGRYNISANKLEDLVIEENGNPIRNVVVSTWRSGSSFFGNIFTARPGLFYHFEPLYDFGINRIRGPLLASQALKNLKALLSCDYTNLDHYLDYARNEPWIFLSNPPLWTQCQDHPSICYNHRFLSKMCKLFPFQFMKILRLRLQFAQELLADEKLGVRMVFLARDPRGVFQSRKYIPFCQESPDCFDPSSLCADMVSDYNTAVELQKKYPSTFRVLRYEDLSVEPYETVEELFEFYRLDFHPNVTEYLDTHTKNNVGHAFTTYRNSKTAPFHWRKELEFEEVKEIQQNCFVPMKHWGYIPAVNASHQREFNPITDYMPHW